MELNAKSTLCCSFFGKWTKTESCVASAKFHHEIKRCGEISLHIEDEVLTLTTRSRDLYLFP